jgi:hypothetical protein
VSEAAIASNTTPRLATLADNIGSDGFAATVDDGINAARLLLDPKAVTAPTWLLRMNTSSRVQRPDPRKGTSVAIGGAFRALHKQRLEAAAPDTLKQTTSYWNGNSRRVRKSSISRGSRLCLKSFAVRGASAPAMLGV